jgi:PAS domain S-box-containing protein
MVGAPLEILMRSKKPTYQQLKKKFDKLEKRFHELKRDKEVFNKIHEKYTALFERNLHCIYVHDVEGRFIDANDAALSLLGYNKKDIDTLSLSSLINEDQLPIAFATIKEIMRSGSQRQPTEYKLKNKMGDSVWIETDGGLMYREGKPYAIQGVARDITQRKKTEKALTNSEKKYRELVQSINSVILRLDPQGNVKFINEFAKEFFGYTEKEIIDKNVIGTIVPKTESSGRDLAAMIKDLGIHPERYINNENENMRKNGHRVWIAWTNKGIHNEDGNILEILCVGNDITERKEAEKALRESEEKFRTLADSAPAAILIVAGEELLYVNPAFESIFGFTKKEALAISFWDIVHPDMKGLIEERGMARQRGEKVPDRYELKAITKDGQTRWIDLSAASIKYGDKLATLAIAYDITDGKHSKDTLFAREQELEKKTRDLEEMNTALKVLLKKRDEDKVELEEKIMTNLKQLVEPYLQSLKQTSLSDRQKNILEIIETNLSELVSPFARNYANLKYKLTPTEIQIVDLIKNGKSTKNIAEILYLSTKTIEFHRDNIRTKLQIKNKKINLRTYLLTLQ